MGLEVTGDVLALSLFECSLPGSCVLFRYCDRLNDAEIVIGSSSKSIFRLGTFRGAGIPRQANAKDSFTCAVFYIFPLFNHRGTQGRTHGGRGAGAPFRT